MIHRSSCIVLASILVVAAPLFSASIGLFSTPDCSSCNLVVPPGGTSTFYVRALTDGIAPDLSMTGAGLKVVGLPAGWSTVSVPNPQATVSVGDPFGPSGARIFFGSTFLYTCIDLYTVSLTATTPAHEVRLHVEGVTSAWDPALICPWFVPGCTPCDFEICVGGGTLFVNSDSGCSVSIENRNWTRIRTLYR